ncbi:MAG: anthranilate phosphoribosyltransferase [Myxococcota bacterium]|nr:anthranilate phosphoribosyltransferase [Myxococcota bacterium]
MSLAEATRIAVSGGEVEASLCESAFDEIMAGKASPVGIAALLVALRTKGESVSEMAAIARALRRHAETAPLPDPGTVDTCGTGGDASGTFNISTLAALVVSGAGVPVAKHGNRAASSRSGSADVLEELGVQVEIPVAQSAAILAQEGIAFFFARVAHPAFRHVAPVRSELGFRTVMNCMGPLLNPVGARRQLIGVFSADLVQPMAEVLAELGSERALVVHGDDGLDEVTLTTTTQAALLEDGAVRRFEIRPEDLALERCPAEALAGGDPAENAAIARAILSGETGPRTDIVLANAGAALVAAGAAPDLASGVARARESLQSGAAADRLEALARATTAAAS